jgi:hypothetical protein
MLSPATACKRTRRGTLPSTPMHRWLKPLGLLAVLALVGYAGVLLLADPEADDAVEAAIADGQAGEEQRDAIEASRERLRRTARRLAMSPGGRLDDDGGEAPDGRTRDGSASAVPYGSGEVDPVNAREGFSYAMSRVDAIVESRRRLSQDEWDTLYRETNDAFAALSMVVDPRDDLQLAELEAAHERLRTGLRKVRVDGKKLAD